MCNLLWLLCAYWWSHHSMHSHYQVIVVYLKDGTLPSQSPDEAFPNIQSFTTYENVANTEESYDAYITAEFAQSLFPSDGLFTVGDPMEVTNDRSGSYPNQPLQYGSQYTFFLRVYPVTQQASGKVQTEAYVMHALECSYTTAETRRPKTVQYFQFKWLHCSSRNRLDWLRL